MCVCATATGNRHVWDYLEAAPIYSIDTQNYDILRQNDDIFLEAYCIHSFPYSWSTWILTLFTGRSNQFHKPLNWWKVIRSMLQIKVDPANLLADFCESGALLLRQATRKDAQTQQKHEIHETLWADSMDALYYIPSSGSIGEKLALYLRRSPFTYGTSQFYAWQIFITSWKCLLRYVEQALQLGSLRSQPTLLASLAQNFPSSHTNNCHPPIAYITP